LRQCAAEILEDFFIILHNDMQSLLACFRIGYKQIGIRRDFNILLGEADFQDDEKRY
jgi:hypothetical protein